MLQKKGARVLQLFKGTWLMTRMSRIILLFKTLCLNRSKKVSMYCILIAIQITSLIIFSNFNSLNVVFWIASWLILFSNSSFILNITSLAVCLKASGGKVRSPRSGSFPVITWNTIKCTFTTYNKNSQNRDLRQRIILNIGQFAKFRSLFLYFMIKPLKSNLKVFLT